ncbi:MAG: histidine kinase [Spirochaetales bacterium]|nr:histidine kinase [Spirochaetales bacterium]
MPFRKFRFLSYRHTLLFILCLVLLLPFSLTLFFIGEKVFGLIILTDILLVSLVYYFFISRPYRRINEHIRNYTYGYINDLNLDGGAQLSPYLEQFFRKVREEIRTERALNSSNKQAEYLALQNQINPHFLYNTLEGIRSDALSAGVDNVAEIIESLAEYFRYTISKVDRLVTIKEELANLDNYLAIQNFRFGDRITLNVEYEDCEKGIEEVFIPKLILQPFIENSIIHGLEGKIGPGTIKITISRTEELLLITIEDDGLGIDEEILKGIDLKTLNRMPSPAGKSPPGGIAIVNVSNRIKLLFGERYGIKIRSMKDFGTSVDLVLPFMEQPLAGGSL